MVRNYIVMILYHKHKYHYSDIELYTSYVKEIVFSESRVLCYYTWIYTHSNF